MKFNQYYLECLSHASYLIGDETTGRAVVIDPQRDVSEYVADAKELGMTIELVIETHFHADFLSGHLELAEATGAKIVYSSVAETEFDSMAVQDGERYSLGDIQLEFRHTPGHTPESMSIVIYEHADDTEPYGVLTGDTLFIGDVGRPDLLSSIGFTREELADNLYDSLHNKLMTLPDSTRVFVGHDYQPDGRPLRFETTIGASKAANIQLRADTPRETYVNFRKTRDATLQPPRLLLPSVQVNVNAGMLPAKRGNGQRYLNIPVNLFGPTDDVGEALPR
jgi:glyoxylase-like metal-dependent hydrolase (beta-lactamase superfamily II)